jgi:hypothetical protein
MKTWPSVAALLVLALASHPARAGLYLPAKLYTSQGREPPRLGKGEVFVGGPWPLASRPAPYYYTQLRPLQNVGATDRSAAKGDLSYRVEKLVAYLEQKGSGLSVEESITLGGCYLLQGEKEKIGRAVVLLGKAAGEARGNFLVLANLAKAYEMLPLLDKKPHLDEAVRWQSLAVDYFPRKYPGWTREQLLFYKRAEQYQLKLFKMRTREPSQPQGQIALDNLFPGVRFVGPDGKYVPDEIDERSAAELPPDALPLVEQLLLGSPSDVRLLWLFAELVNAQGDAKLASKVLTILKKLNVPSEELAAHEAVLSAAAKAEKDPAPPPLASGGGSGGLLDWRQLGVGFGSGLLIGVLLMLQMRQWGRRS